MAPLNYRDAEVSKQDPGNKDVVGREISKTEQLGLFCTTASAMWAADKILKKGSYPLANPIIFTTNRKSFKYQPGDPFILNYKPYDISGKICRVLRKQEDSPESEKITIWATEDVDYLLSEVVQYAGKSDDKDPKSNIVEDLTKIVAMEAPHILSGNEIKMVVIAAKEKGNEKGYTVYYSPDGSTYSNIGSYVNFAIYGSLNQDYTDQTFDIDDHVGIYVDFASSQQASIIETIARDDMIAARNNLCLMGDELITFQTITPVSGTIYKLEGVYRGRWDTTKDFHSSGEDFYWLGAGDRYGLFKDSTFVPINTRYAKVVPYNDQYAGSEANAEELEVEVTGRAYKPYYPIHFAANDRFSNAVYTDDIILTWRGRIKGGGAGFGDADTIVDETPIWEGLFDIEVWVSGVKVNTFTGIDFLTFNYDEATNISDNGILASSITFKLKNYKIINEITFSSDQVEITVTKE